MQGWGHCAVLPRWPGQPRCTSPRWLQKGQRGAGDGESGGESEKRTRTTARGEAPCEETAMASWCRECKVWRLRHCSLGPTLVCHSGQIGRHWRVPVVVWRRPKHALVVIFFQGTAWIATAGGGVCMGCLPTDWCWATLRRRVQHGTRLCARFRLVRPREEGGGGAW